MPNLHFKINSIYFRSHYNKTQIPIASKKTRKHQYVSDLKRNKLLLPAESVWLKKNDRLNNGRPVIDDL